jgi:succinate dehydrogenase hydrophobic anchor subunit
MDSEKKFYLLAELSGWNCTPYCKGYGETIKKSNSYRVLSYNIPEAKKHLSGKARVLCDSYQKINLEPESVKDCFLVENAVNYLALHSYPAFYLNPLAIDPGYQGEVSSIGDLIISYKGGEKTINEIILDDKTVPEEKKKEVDRAFDGYLADMDLLAERSIRSLTPALGKNKEDTHERRIAYVDSIFSLVFVVFFLFLLLNPNESFYALLYAPNWGKAMTYVLLIYPIFLFLFLFVTLFYHSYADKTLESYHYARKFVRKNQDVLYSDLKNGKERLYDYVAGAINSRIILKNDITDFSLLSTSYIDYRNVLLTKASRNKKMYRTLENLDRSFFFALLAIFLFAFTITLLSLLFNTVV